MERDGARLTASVIEKNRRFQEQKVKDMETTITEMAKEHGKLSTRALMPVGNNHKLLVARRRKRNMGEWSF